MKQYAPQTRQRVISQDTATTVARMMESVTGEGGTGTAASVDGFKVAGKTGTAQKADPVTHGYSADKRTASFGGFIPSDKPKLTILVVIDEPKTSPYGGVVAAPAFSAIARQSLCYLRVSPNQPLKKKGAVEAKKEEPKLVASAAEKGAEDLPDESAEGGLMMGNYRGMSVRQVLKQMEKRGVNIRIIGSGKVVEQNPPPGRKITPGDPAWVKLAPSA